MPGVLAIADAVVAAITAGWVAPFPADVTREYEEKIDFGPDLAVRTIGRKVFVIPLGYGRGDPLDRQTDNGDRNILISIAELYEGGEPEPPKAWLDERVNWVESEIFDKLTDQREENVLEGIYPVASELAALYDEQMLREQNLFLSFVTVTYRKSE